MYYYISPCFYLLIDIASIFGRLEDKRKMSVYVRLLPLLDNYPFPVEGRLLHPRSAASTVQDRRTFPATPVRIYSGPVLSRGNYGYGHGCGMWCRCAERTTSILYASKSGINSFPSAENPSVRGCGRFEKHIAVDLYASKQFSIFCCVGHVCFKPIDFIL